VPGNAPCFLAARIELGHTFQLVNLDVSMARVYLHIGAPKTATSTLQHVLANNVQRLLKSGVLYPRTVGHGNAHHTLVCDLVEKHRGQTMPDIWYGDIPRGETWSLLQAEMTRHGAAVHSVILSSELFFGQVHELDPILKDVAAHLRGHDVRVIVYLRRQDQLYSSFYNQDVKGIRQWSNSAYQFYQTHQMFEYGYHSVMKIWSDAFGKGNIIIRPFESGQWPGGNIVQDFCDSLGIVSLQGSAEENYESLGMIQLYVKRCLNKVGFAKSLNDEILRILYTLCPEEPVKGCLYVHKKLYMKYRDQWLQDNLILSNEYLERAELFSQPIPRADELKVYEINRFNTALYVRNMFDAFKQGRYRKHRQLFSKATLLVLADQNLWNALKAHERPELLEWATAIDK
jgi:hypothetical protein